MDKLYFTLFSASKKPQFIHIDKKNLCSKSELTDFFLINQNAFLKKKSKNHDLKMF